MPESNLLNQIMGRHRREPGELEAIDRRIFPKLTPAQRKTIREDAAALIDLLEEIRRDADV